MPDAPTAATTTAPVSDREGTTRRVRRGHEPKGVDYRGRRALPEPPAHEAREEEPHQGAERRQQRFKLEREAFFEPPVSEAADYLLGTHHTDHHCSVPRQAPDPKRRHETARALAGGRRGPGPPASGGERRARKTGGRQTAARGNT